VILFL
jgi:hypothetical protein